MGAYDSYNRYDWHLNPGILTVKYGKPIEHKYYKNMTVDELKDDIYKKIAILCENDSINQSPIGNV